MSLDIETATFARLDAAGVYWGVQTLPLPAADEHVAVPFDCDLAPGRYRWNAIDKRFDALAVALTEPGQISVDAVVAELVRFAQAQGATAPLFEQFIKQFNASLDASNGGAA